MPTITFMPAGLVADYRQGESIFDVGQRHAVAIETSCVGQGTCGLCRVRVLAGEEHLGPVGEIDEKHLGNVYYLTKVRLSCQARPTGGDVVVELAPQKKSKKVPKRAGTPFPTR
jgi:ferredoxin